MPFPPRDIRKKSLQHVRACAAGDGAICSKNRKIVPYQGANPNTRNGARSRSPSPSMAPVSTYYLEDGRHLARLHRRRRRRRRAYAPTSNTPSHDNHEKINSWVSFSFLYVYGAPLGGPSGRRSSAINCKMEFIYVFVFHKRNNCFPFQ